MPQLPADELGGVWFERLERLPRLQSAGDLYCGRAFQDAKAAADQIDAGLYIVSAGLGLIEKSTLVPAYSMTLAPVSEDCVFRRTEASPADWWRVLTAQSPFHCDLEASDGLILAALSRPYLDMVAQEWAQWPTERVERLRLFCKGPPSGLPPELSRQWMPYDDRLDLSGGARGGTQADFAQRALRHFAEHMGPQTGELDQDRQWVENALAPFILGARPDRRRMMDADLIDLIGREWDAAGGRSGAMLRRLRRELNIACEQARFKDLFLRAAKNRLERPHDA